MNKDIQTNRLRLRRITTDDYMLIRHLDIDPEVKKYLGPPSDKSVTDQRMEKIKKRNNDGSGLGYWMGEELISGKTIGWFVLNNLDGSEHIEIGYRLATDFWGKGYATEGARALLKYGFMNVILKTIVGVTHPENVPSKRVLEKIGLVEKGLRYFYQQDVSYFELTRKDYIDVTKN